MARRQAMRRSRAATLAAVALAVLPLAALRTAHSFVPAPRSGPVLAPQVVAAVGAVALLAPLAAHAELPPLEDLPLEGLRGGWVQEREAEVPNEMTFNIFGIAIPVALLGLPVFLIPPMLAATWAYGWVTNTDPFDSKLKTYLGAGELPPEGYTNPLDPRIDEINNVDDDDDDLPPVKSRKRKAVATGPTSKSALV
mmetsp:Transcript_89580/g.231212  ORF Transcript_89580/g.231212 Transcript_89580/m.231212 type:complete len:196 (-) Transcript_89580:120-707(-)